MQLDLKVRFILVDPSMRPQFFAYATSKQKSASSNARAFNQGAILRRLQQSEVLHSFNEAAVLAVCNPGASCAAGHGVWPSMRPRVFAICNSAWMDIENIRAGPSMRPQFFAVCNFFIGAVTEFLGCLQ